MRSAAVAPSNRTIPAVVLTFLAPADRCNQRCPQCIIDLVGEPVRRFDLAPEDYAAVLTQTLDASIPVLCVNFQGFEVTLPRSWPYVEAVFYAAQQCQVRRSFITNGMLLDRWTDRIVDLSPQRVAVSIDGADATVNDRIRGVDGAFVATTRSIERFLNRAPAYSERVSIVSTLYDEENFRSLQSMPKLLRRWGIPRWALGFGLTVEDGRERPLVDRHQMRRWTSDLVARGESEGVRVYINDELGFYSDAKNPGPIRSHGLFDPSTLVRVEPAGFFRVGREVVEAFDPARARRYDPHRDNFGQLLRHAFASSSQLRIT